MTNDMYMPNPKALAFNQLQFVSISSRAAGITTVLDYDRIFGEVSSEIMTLFVSESVETPVSIAPAQTGMYPASGLEAANS